MKTNLENYEERFVDYIEGQLDAAEMREVEAFVAQHPELEEDFKLFCASKLEPDTAIVFTKKDCIRQSKAVVIPMFAKVFALAASIALLIGIGIHFLNDRETLLQPASLISCLTPKTGTKIEVPKATPQPKRPIPSIPQTTAPNVEKAQNSEPMLLAQAEVIPTLKSIKSSSVQWDQDDMVEQLESRLDMGLDLYLATLNPMYDEESSEDYTYDEESSKLATRLYKRTAKALLTAYYTADCYINEARHNVQR